ncbi:unnamed protein product [Malus baccata var. baccata]
MKKGRTMKEARVMKKGTMTLTFMQSFPNKFLLEILTNVASRSFRYIYSTKMVCKKNTTMIASSNTSKFERVNPLTSQSRDEKVYKFLELRREFNNPEVLYNQGM